MGARVAMNRLETGSDPSHVSKLVFTVGTSPRAGGRRQQPAPYLGWQRPVVKPAAIHAADEGDQRIALATLPADR